ncbi:MAG: sugar-binding transcriptional regulator [Anaerolineales bacterium]
MNNDNQELMIRAAWMYYSDNMTHEQIAQKLHLSRVKVTRMLQKAREEGIVEISITYPLPLNHRLSQELEANFNLNEAVIIPTGQTYDMTLKETGRAAADYLNHVIEPGCRVGFGWSTTVSHMGAHLSAPTKRIDFSVVDLMGSMLGRSNPYSVSGKIAETYGATLYPLTVPIVVRNKEAYDAIMNDLNVQHSFELVRSCDLGFAGVGNMGITSTLVQSNYLTPEEMDNIHKDGAVGDILMRYYDIDGNPVPTVMDDFVIGLTWAELKRLPRVVVVAVGQHKIEPVVGILRSGICDVLITDAETAEGVLAYSAP